MKKFDFKLILAFFAVIICTLMMAIFLLPIIRDKQKSININSTNYRVLIINKRTSDTIMDKKIKSLSPVELDSLTLYLNKTK